MFACRFGEVVSLLTDMTAAGVSPNLNTYRIIINACQRAGQAGLAFQVFALMHGNHVKILQNKFAQTIYYTLIKCCFNQVRQVWSTSGVDARSPQLSAGTLQRREQEAKRVLAALGGVTQRRSNPFDAPPDTIDWASHAVSAFQHMLSRGHTPTLTLLDM